MIDICQWRAAIGHWYYCQVSCSCSQRNTNCNTTCAKWMWLILTHLVCSFATSLTFLLLLLSGDVELNPGPTVEEVTKEIKEILRHHFAELQVVTHCCLKEIAAHLFAKKLITEPVKDSPTYDKIVKEFNAAMAFMRDVSQVESHCQLFLECLSSQSGPTKVAAHALDGQWNEVFSKSAVSPVDVESSSSPTSPTSDPDSERIIEISSETEKKFQLSLRQLHVNFSDLMTTVQSILRNRIKHNTQVIDDIAVWVQTYMNWEPGTLSNDLNDILKKIHPYYDFIDCEMIVHLSEKFLEDITFHDDKKHLVTELRHHLGNAETLRSSASIAELKKKLQSIYRPHQRDLKNMPNICIQLHNPWNDSNIKGLYLLIQQLLPMKLRQSLINYITIESGSVCIRYTVLDSTADSLIAYAQRKLQFMRLIGIFGLVINGHPILLEDENMNFTFELALHKAARTGHIEAVEFLLGLGADINYQKEDGATTLMLASRNGHDHVVKLLLDKEFDPNIQRQDGATALTLASNQGHYNVVELLVSKQADPNKKENNGWTALMLASKNGHDEVVEIILPLVDPDIRRENGWTALMFASHYGHYQVVKMLRSHHANPNLTEEDGWTALMLAAQSGHYKVTTALLNKMWMDMGPNIQSKKGVTALMLASKHGHHRVVKLLLDKQADVNIQSQNNVSALMLASKNGHREVVELLLIEMKPIFKFLDSKDKNGWTALMLASQAGHYQIVEHLLQHNADPLIQTNSGETAVLLALKNGHDEVVKLLKTKKHAQHERKHEKEDLGVLTDKVTAGYFSDSSYFISPICSPYTLSSPLSTDSAVM